jgi:site-specific DNA-methyltransferase (adenine-specific)
MNINMNQILHGDCLDHLKDMPENHVDLICTDPPYQLSGITKVDKRKDQPFARPQARRGFMGKEWDVIPPQDIWNELYRVLKHGAFAFIMCSPRLDCLTEMGMKLKEAGFVMSFSSIFWSYASGFPKASNISKMVDKRNGRQPQQYKELGEYLRSMRGNRPQKDISKYFPSKTGGLTGCVANWELGFNVPTKEQWIILKKELNLDNRYDELIERTEAEREVVGKIPMTIGIGGNSDRMGKEKIIDLPETPQAKALDGSYAGFQPKPAVENILDVC